MIRINIINVLRSQNKSLNWLACEVKCDYSNLWNICHNKTKLINLELVEKICKTLGCDVGDIIVIEDEVEE